MADMKTVTINGITYRIEDPDALSGTDTTLSAANKAADASAVGAALAGKAPAGYGLGGQGAYITDCNIAQTGFYRFDADAWNRPFDYGTMIVSGRYDGNCNQIAICQDGGDRGAVAFRQYGAAGAQWEFLNPRLVPGVEYRTAERVNGEPVYVKHFDLGTMPNNGTIRQLLDITYVKSIVRFSCAAYADSNDNGNNASFALVGSSNKPIVNVNQDYVEVTTTVDESAYNHTLFTVYYLKK